MTRRLSPQFLRLFRADDYTALYVAGPLEIVPRRMGDNRGGRPVRIGVTASLDDTVTPIADGWSPFWECRIHFRLWTRGDVFAKRILAAVQEIGAARGEGARKSWIDFGPDYDPSLFEMELHGIAADLSIKAWDDHALMAHLQDRLEQEVAAVREMVAAKPRRSMVGGT